MVERGSKTGELSLSCARPAGDGLPLMWVNHPLQVSQLGQLSLSSFLGRKMSSKAGIRWVLPFTGSAIW